MFFVWRFLIVCVYFSSILFANRVVFGDREIVFVRLRSQIEIGVCYACAWMATVRGVCTYPDSDVLLEGSFQFYSSSCSCHLAGFVRVLIWIWCCFIAHACTGAAVQLQLLSCVLC